METSPAFIKEDKHIHRGRSGPPLNNTILLMNTNTGSGSNTRNSLFPLALMNSFRFITLLLVALVTGTTACAQDKINEIDKIFSGITPTAPGCVCAVSQNGKIVLNRAYGLADLERNVPLTTNTIFDAGSVVKQFVAASVLLLVEEGRLSLSENIRKYIPELPDPGHKITLDHLLTHTSGVRDWTGIRPLTEGDPDALMMTLRQRGLNFAPGEEWSYSNSGYVLLKEIVARTSGMSFTEFTQKRLFGPLGMKHSNYLLDMTDLVPNRALAYGMDKGRLKLDMHFGNDRGGGGALMSTPGDLLLWNEALANGTLGAFVSNKIQEPAILNNGRKINYARGLFLDTGRAGNKIIWHSGGSAGYSTLLGRYPDQGISIAIMCNADGGARSAYASRIVDLFLPPASRGIAAESNSPGTSGGGTSIAGAEPAGKAGLFFNEQTAQPLRLAVNNGTLAIAGGGPLVTLSPDRFRTQRSSLSFMSQADIEIQFLTADRFEIRTKEGGRMAYRRAGGFKPSVADLNAFAGQYESNEMGSVLEIVPEKEGLVMRFYRNPSKALHFKPVDHDTYMMNMMTIRFIRNKEGKVVGYDYSNPLVRNVRFTKLGAGK